MSDGKKYGACVIGLGAMGMGVAQSCVNAGLATYGVDVAESARERLSAFGAAGVGADAMAFADKLDAIMLLVVNAQQERQALLEGPCLTDALKPGTVVLLSATVSPEAAQSLGAELERRGLLVLDAPVSGGSVKAAQGDITVMASGREEAFAKAKPLLDAVAGKVYNVGAELGRGTTVKIIHQLLAGVHIAAAAEAMGLASRAGIPLEVMYDVVTHAAGNSWMFENRMKRFIEGNREPFSKIDIFVKDLGLVAETGRSLKFPLPLATTAHGLFTNVSNAGFGNDDDSLLIKAYAGIEIPGEEPSPGTE